MYIYELEQDAALTLTVHLPDKTVLEWKCQVLENSTKGRCIIIPPLKNVEGKIINFAPDVRVDAEVVIIKDGKPFIFKNCHLQLIKLKDKKVHAIICKQPGINYNRRAYFRIPIDEYCYVNHGTATVDALLLDMSASGFGFIVGHYDGNPMDFVQVSYHDSLMNIDIKVMGRVVRRINQDDGRTFFGCYMIPRPDIVKYINTRQSKTIKTRD